MSLPAEGCPRLTAVNPYFQTVVSKWQTAWNTPGVSLADLDLAMAEHRTAYQRGAYACGKDPAALKYPEQIVAKYNAASQGIAGLPDGGHYPAQITAEIDRPDPVVKTAVVRSSSINLDVLTITIPSGTANLSQDGGASWQPATGGQSVYPGMLVQSGNYSAVVLTYADGSTVSLTSNQTMDVQKIDTAQSGDWTTNVISSLQKTANIIQNLINAPSGIQTPSATAGVRG